MAKMPFVPLIIVGLIIITLIGFVIGIVLFTHFSQNQTFADHLISKLTPSAQNFVYTVIHYTELLAELLGIDLDITSGDEFFVPSFNIRQFSELTGVMDVPTSAESPIPTSPFDPAYVTKFKTLSSLPRVSEPSLSSRLPQIASVSTDALIPKKMFFTLPHDASQSTLKLCNQNISVIKSDNPDYHVTVFDSSSSDQYMETYAPPDLLIVYKQSSDGVVKQSLLKYFVVFREGGAFLDSGCKLSAPLSSIIKPTDEFLLFSRSTSSDKPSECWGAMSILSSRTLISTSGHVYLATFIPILISVVSRAQAHSKQTISDMAKIAYLSESSFTKRFLSVIQSLKSKSSLLGDYGRECVVGDILFTQIVSPLAAGARFGLKGSLVDKPRHRFMNGLHDLDSPIYVSPPSSDQLHPKTRMVKSLFNRSKYAS